MSLLNLKLFRDCSITTILLLFSLSGYGNQYVVTSTNDSGAGSLRQAIISANSSSGLDTVIFTIPGVGPHTIVLSSALPPITDWIRIDGYSEPGSSENTERDFCNAVIQIAIDGNNGGFPGFQLIAGSGRSTIRGLCMYDFGAPGIRINVGSDDNRIQGNFLGTDVTGTVQVGNQCNIEVYSALNEIGEGDRKDRNIICSNSAGAGIIISGPSATGIRIRNNYIGLSADGVTAIADLLVGIQVDSGAQVEIGGVDNDLNRITGTAQEGISVLNLGTQADIMANQIFQVGGVAIDLNGDGHTPNDPGDGDAGPNNLANYPTILRAMTDDYGAVYAEVTISNSVPGSSHRFDWYLVGTPDASGHGDALTWLGKNDYDADASGFIQKEFTFGREMKIPVGSQLCVTVTNTSTNGTSELSQNFTLAFGQNKVTNTSDIVNGNINSVIDLILSPGADGISYREAILAGNNNKTNWGCDMVLFDIPGPTPHAISITSTLPTLLSQFCVYGISEPDYVSTPVVILDGAMAGGGAHGVDVQHDYCDIYGLSVVNFNGDGVYGLNADNVHISGMYIGVMPDGITPAGNSGYGVRVIDSHYFDVGESSQNANVISANGNTGIRVEGSDSYYIEIEKSFIGLNALGTAALPNLNNGITIIDGAHDVEIGSSTSSKRNFISGNVNHGILVQDLSVDDIEIRGNYIGTDITGTSSIGNGEHGILIDASNENFIGGTTSNKRNIISGNLGDGIHLLNCASNLIHGNYIGLDESGTLNLGNASDGIQVSNSSGNTIGGLLPDEENVISGNGSSGIKLAGAGSHSNQILGNKIGTNADGTAAIGTQDIGIKFTDGPHDNEIGDGTASGRNLISGNAEKGIFLVANGNPGSDNNIIIGNYIGADITGNLPLGNGDDGITIDYGINNRIGGATIGERNVIGANGDQGIDISYAGTSGNLVQGNYIGIGADGLSNIGNTNAGITIESTASGNTVGGSAPNMGNVISFNNADGIRVRGVGNIILGNIIGLDPTGTIGAGNVEAGIDVNSPGDNTLIGGAGANERNVISDNGSFGVYLQAPGCEILGNFIGTDITGTLAFGNSESGIQVESDDNVIGGLNAGEGNLIANNVLDGITVDGASTRNSILRNDIFDNDGLGIDLSDDNVTANDSGDGDAGPNELQNFPTIDLANFDGTNTTIDGILNSTANQDFRIEIFSSTTADPSGYGEGERYIISTDVTTDASGNASFSLSTASISNGEYVTSTATYLTAGVPKSTSEYSEGVEAKSLELCNDGIDNDGDGLIDCADDDCYLASKTGGSDTDGDGIDDNCDLDDDNDGLLDTVESPGLPAYMNVATSDFTIYTTGDPSSGVVSKTLDSLALFGTYYSDFFYPTGYNHLFTSPSNPHRIYTLNNGTVDSYYDVTTTWNADALVTCQNTNFNHYTNIYSSVVSGIDYSELVYSTPLVVNSELFCVISERRGNNSVWVEGFDEFGTSLGSPRYVDVSDYVNTGLKVGMLPASSDSVFVAIFPVMELAEIGNEVHSVRMYYEELAGDAADSKLWMIGDQSMQYLSLNDSDSDGILNHLDLDSDNDGLFDVQEAGGVDPDFNGIIGSGTSASISDLDNDGWSDIVDVNSGGTPLVDLNTDSNGFPNRIDLDSDDDGCSDVLEAGFTDDNTDGVLGDSPVTVDSDGLVTSGVDGYTGTAAVVTNPALQAGCPDNDSDGISDFNDLDDDNDGILDIVEYDCTPVASSAFVWEHNVAPQDEARIVATAWIASVDDETFGAGLGAYYGGSTVRMTGVDQMNLTTAMANDDYIGGGFTTQGGIDAASIQEFWHLKHPAAAATPDSYGYSVAVLISSDNFSTYQQLASDNINSSVPATYSAEIIGSIEDNHYTISPSTHYDLRIYFFNKITDLTVPALFDDFILKFITCNELEDQDSDGIPNQLDQDSDGDSCSDVIEAGFPDADGDNQLGGLVPPTVDSDGKVTSGGL